MHFVLSRKQMPQASGREMTVAAVRGRGGAGAKGGGAKDGALPISPTGWFQIINMNSTD